MRLFAMVAETLSFTAAASTLGVPKQTLSRRIAELEASLGVVLLRRTTRRLQLTEVGAAYAERCREVVGLADDANRAVTDADQVPAGTLRITADPIFGDAFLTDLVVEYATQWPELRLEIVLTRRQVDLVSEGFDVAFRVGRCADDPALTVTRLGPAQIRYCASPEYLKRQGTPSSPSDLRSHACIVVSEGAAARWPFRERSGDVAITVSGRLSVTSFAMAHAAALAGLGIALFPAFACRADIANGRLVPILEDFGADVGDIAIVHPTHRYFAPRVRIFVDAATEKLRRHLPWDPPPSPRGAQDV